MDPRVQAVIDELHTRIESEEAAISDGMPRRETRDQRALAAGPQSAGLLNLLVRTKSARSIVEVGTSIGYTALWLGEAARDTGGHVIGMEYIDKKYDEAIDNIKRAGLDGIVEVHKGDAKEIVAGLDGPIDLAFVDAWKDDYIAYFDLLLPKLAVGGCVVADNITYPDNVRALMQQYQAHVRAKPNVRSQLLAIGSGLEMSVKTAD
ncbi:MAG: class I SAM-dependent methyltransferase [Alphaproteobacteria bacterium]|nr:class I SAM-dependent methyltransferase [Alphaproteobacteria bacterium]